MLTRTEIVKLLHDLKRASKAVKLIRDETNEEKRKLLSDLIANELDRLYEDMIDLTEKK